MKRFVTIAPAFLALAASAATNDIPASAISNTPENPNIEEQIWNWHVQNTDIVQYHPGFSARYSGPNSLKSASEVKETVSFDVLIGVRLWSGAEFHVDGLMWQGFGLSDARGIDGFPNGEAFRLGQVTQFRTVMATVALLNAGALGGT